MRAQIDYWKQQHKTKKKKKPLGTLEIVSQFKLQSLTVILDSDLIFNSHIDSVT